MKKYFLFLFLLTCASLLPMDPPEDNLEKAVAKIMEHSDEINNLTCINLTRNIALKFNTIKDVLNDIPDDNAPLQLLNISDQSLDNLLSVFHETGELNKEALSKKSIHDLLDIARDADYLAYNDEETTLDHVTDHLISPETKELFVKEKLNLNNLSQHYMLCLKLLEKIKPHIPGYVLSNRRPIKFINDERISSIGISPDGQYLIASTGYNTKIKLYAVGSEALTPITSFRATNDPFIISITPDSEYIVTASYFFRISVWNRETGALIHTIEDGINNIDTICFTPDGNYIGAIANIRGHSRIAKVWNLKNGTLIHTLIGHEGDVGAICSTPDSNQIITGSSDSNAIVWDIITGRIVHVLSGHNKSIDHICVTPNGCFIITNSYDRTIKIWDRITGELVHTLDVSTSLLCITPDSKCIITGGNKLKMWDIETGKLIKTISENARPNNSDPFDFMKITPDGNYIIMWPRVGLLKIWNIKTDSLVLSILVDKINYWGVHIAPDSSYIAICSAEKTLALYPMNDEKLNTDLRHCSLEQLLLTYYSLVYAKEMNILSKIPRSIFNSCHPDIKRVIRNQSYGWSAYLKNNLAGAAYLLIALIGSGLAYNHNMKKNKENETQAEPSDSTPEIYDSLAMQKNVSWKSKLSSVGPLTLALGTLACGTKLILDTLDSDRTFTQSLLQGIVTSIAVGVGYKIYKWYKSTNITPHKNHIKKSSI